MFIYIHSENVTTVMIHHGFDPASSPSANFVSDAAGSLAPEPHGLGEDEAGDRQWLGADRFVEELPRYCLT